MAVERLDGLSWLGMGVESLGWAWRASGACGGPKMGYEPVMGVEGLEWSVDGLGWLWRSWDGYEVKSYGYYFTC